MDGKPTTALTEVLKAIFDRYCTTDDGSDDDNNSDRASYTMAGRLWYRCGMKLSSLDSLLEKKNQKLGEVEFKDFLQVVSEVIGADTDSISPDADFEVRAV